MVKRMKMYIDLTSSSKALPDGRKFPDTPIPILMKEEFSSVKAINLNKESKESIELKQQAKKNLRKSLIENGKFDADIIEEIMEVFDITAADYDFVSKKK